MFAENIHPRPTFEETASTAPEANDPVAVLGDRLRAERQDFDRVPMVDLGPLDPSAPRDADRRDKAAADIRWALANVGFMYVRSHGVAEETVRRAFDASRTFFAQHQDEKMRLHITRSGGALRGFTELFGENTNPGVTRDYKECFDAGPEYSRCIGPFRGPNLWPEEGAVPGFRGTICTYLDAMLVLSRRILRGLALSLDLDEAYFERLMREPVMIQRLLHYPSQSGMVDEDTIGIGAHTDYGLMTVLAQDDVGGLQVMNRNGRWIEAPPVPETFVVNIGDLVQRLTNDRYLANLHRVVNVSGRERYSMACFVDCDFDAKIAPLESCVTATAPLAYEPVQAGANKLARYAPTFAHLTYAEK